MPSLCLRNRDTAVALCAVGAVVGVDAVAVGDHTGGVRFGFRAGSVAKICFGFPMKERKSGESLPSTHFAPPTTNPPTWGPNWASAHIFPRHWKGTALEQVNALGGVSEKVIEVSEPARVDDPCDAGQGVADAAVPVFSAAANRW